MKAFQIITLCCIITAVSTAYQNAYTDHEDERPIFDGDSSFMKDNSARSKNVGTNEKQESTETVEQEIPDELEEELTMSQVAEPPTKYKTECINDLHLIGDTPWSMAENLGIILTHHPEYYYYNAILEQTINRVTIRIKTQEANCTNILNDQYLCEAFTSLNNLYGVYAATDGDHTAELELQGRMTRPTKWKLSIKSDFLHRATERRSNTNAFHSWDMSSSTNFVIKSESNAESLKVYVLVMECSTNPRCADSNFNNGTVDDSLDCKEKISHHQSYERLE